MPFSLIRSWDKLYDLLGYPEAEDPEVACAIIITTFTAPHQNPVIALENFYVNIKLHSHLSAVPVSHFGEVTQRLATILPWATMAGISIEVLQLPGPCRSRSRSRSNFAVPGVTPSLSEDEPAGSRR